jgi:hypothetical protein
MMVQKQIFLQQESYYLLCTQEIHHFKRQCQTILIISLLNKKKLMSFGKLTQEEEPLIILVINLKTCLQEWLHIILKKDQKYKKLQVING